MDERDFAAAADEAGPDATASPGEPVSPAGSAKRRPLRRDAIVLGGLLVVTAVVFGGIAWDAGWIGPADTVPASQVTGPAAGPNTGPVTGPPSSVGPAPRSRPPASSANGGAGGASGQGGRDGSGSGSASSIGGRTQGDYARDAMTRPAPRPPLGSGIPQDELDRRREAAEATVPVETASMPVPGTAP